VNTLERAFRIIALIVANQAQGLNFAQIAAETGAPKASAHRILKELVRLGYLVLDPETARYRGSLKLSGLGSEVVANFDLHNQVRAHLLALHRETEHACHLGIRNGGVGVYLDKIESRDYGIKLFSEVGKSFPLHCTALGKVLLAFMDRGEAEDILGQPLKALTDKTITQAAGLKEELARIRRQGFALDREEITRGLMCVAAPVFGPKRRILGALSTTFPAYIQAEKGIDFEIEAVRRHAQAASRVLGGGREPE